MTVIDPRIARTPDAPGLFVALAPMDGVTDWVYRDLMTRLHGGHSGISMCVSEFVRVTSEPVVPKVVERHCPEVSTGGTTAAGVPVFVQLLGGQPQPMAASAKLAAQMGAPGIDINFGCPAKTVNRSDGGATILQFPERLEAITAAVRAAVPQPTPVSVKIRLGWDSAETVVPIVQAIERGGATWLTIHARTRMQGYRPPVDWSSIGTAADAVNIPVVANGDLNTVEDLDRCAQVSRCSAFMIGRGAMGRPRLFRALRGHRDPDLDPAWLCEQLVEYADMLLDRGATPHATVGRCKQWLRLAAPACPAYADLFQALKRVATLPEFLGRLQGQGIEPGELRLGFERPAAPSPA